jgi:hypothetical protein
MWTHEDSATTEIAPDRIWRAIRDLHTGKSSPDDADRFEIHGPFAVGTELSVTPQGQETFRSVITGLVVNELYQDETAMGDVTLRFRHTLDALATGGTRVTHRLEIDGPAAAEVGPELGPAITQDFPKALDALIAAAGRL